MNTSQTYTIYLVKAITESGVVQLGAWADPAEAAAFQAVYPGKARVVTLEVDFDPAEADHLA